MQNKGKLCAKCTLMKETNVDLSLIHVKLDEKKFQTFLQFKVQLNAICYC